MQLASREVVVPIYKFRVVQTLTRSIEVDMEADSIKEAFDLVTFNAENENYEWELSNVTPTPNDTIYVAPSNMEDIRELTSVRANEIKAMQARFENDN